MFEFFDLSAYLAQTADEPQAVDAPGTQTPQLLSNSQGTLSSPLQPGTPSQAPSSSNISPSHSLGAHHFPELSAHSLELGLSEFLSSYDGCAGIPLLVPGALGAMPDPWTGEADHSFPVGLRPSAPLFDETEVPTGPALRLGRLPPTFGEVTLPAMLPSPYPTYPGPSIPLSDTFPPPPIQPSSRESKGKSSRSKKRKAPSPTEDSNGVSPDLKRRKHARMENDASEAGPSTPRRRDPPAASNPLPLLPFPTASPWLPHHGPSPLGVPNPGSSGPRYSPYILPQFHGPRPGLPPRPSTSRSNRRPLSSPTLTPVASTSRLSPIPTPLPLLATAPERYSNAIPTLETIPSTASESSASSLWNETTLASAPPAETVPEAVVGLPSAPVPGIPLPTAGHISQWYAPPTVPPPTSAHPPTSSSSAPHPEVAPKESDDHPSEGTKPRKDKGKAKAKAVEEEAEADEKVVAEEEEGADAHEEGVQTPTWPDVSPEWPMAFVHNEEDGQTGPQDGVRKPPDDKAKAFTLPPKRALPCHAEQQSKADTQAELKRLYITGSKETKFVCKYQNPYTRTITERRFGALDSALRHLHARYRRDRHYIDQRWILREQSHLVNIYHYCPELVAKALSLACLHPACAKVPLSRSDAFARHNLLVHGVEMSPPPEKRTTRTKGSATKTKKAATAKTKKASSTKTQEPSATRTKKATSTVQEPVASSSKRKLEDIDWDDGDDGEYQDKPEKRQRKT
ncbi:hypothetical protein SISSUDRAFT_1045947 [Sistotremastrum suecicum HHB10207 ss-3]|uniref:Uncharacterized protein n=1 Tax=Sistotremastrum suecicum HHB10207 ss-3 TaxID=1314776 RepID=A0A166E422_9AGAM|nr:hypothetical protein SISSUDRAFT_1045947 [Sistotremastrum suecicum HHB10207 ss-3]